MVITLISYSLKKGPHPEGLTRKPLDVRNFYNPHHDPKAKALTGLDQYVQDLLWADKRVRDYVDVLAYSLAESSVLGVRCTHGRHRSVAFVELLAKRLRAEGRTVTVIHRDIDK